MTTAEVIAAKFHEYRETLAPLFDVEQHDLGRVPFFVLPESHRKLLVAVVEQLLEDGVIAPPDDDYGWADSELAKTLGENGDGGSAAAEHFRRRRAEREEERRAIGKAYLAEEERATPDAAVMVEAAAARADDPLAHHFAYRMTAGVLCGDPEHRHSGRCFVYAAACAYPGCGKPWNDAQHTHLVLDDDDPLDDAKCTVGPIEKLSEWQAS